MPNRTFLFAHGAGASSSHPWMQAWTERLATLGTVHPFDYPYMQAGRRPPDRLPKLVDAHLTEAARVRQEGSFILVGKSMGSRVGCHAANQLGADAVICLGYPLVSMGKTRRIRDEVLLSLQRPILFVQGTRDAMGPLDLFAEVRTKMTAPNALHVVEGGDHSLVLSKRHCTDNATTQEDADDAVLHAISAFLVQEGL